jgi:hypothetical protein
MAQIQRKQILNAAACPQLVEADIMVPKLGSRFADATKPSELD